MSKDSAETFLISGSPQPPVDAVEAGEAWRGRVRLRWFLSGFIAGIVLDLVATTGQVVGRDYTLADAPHLLIWNLPVIPWLALGGAVFGVIRTRKRGPWAWRPRFRTRTLMLVVVYLAFLLTSLTASLRLGVIEREHFQRAVNAEEMIKVFREQSLKSKAELKLRRENATQIENGKIPEGLFDGQANFLRSLDNDPKVTPEYRKYRRGLIQETQAHAADRQEITIEFCRKIVEYNELLETKYQRASLRPWLPVEPDPPAPH